MSTYQKGVCEVNRQSGPGRLPGAAGRRIASPKHTASRTLQIFLDRSPQRADKPKRLYRNPMVLAQEWQAKIDDGDVPSRSELARVLGVSRARVTQILQLLMLNPSVIDAILQLGNPLPGLVVSERPLRELVRLGHRQQEQWLGHVLQSEISNIRQVSMTNSN